MSTSSSSPTYPTTQREHSAHPAHLQAHSVDKLRHQESLWREDLQSGGNPRITTPTVSSRTENNHQANDSPPGHMRCPCTLTIRHLRCHGTETPSHNNVFHANQ